jgi:SAM-dependent methyltransferase
MRSSPRFWTIGAALLLLFLVLSYLVLATANLRFKADELFGPKLDAGFITTSPELVDGMLKLAKVGKDDMVYDLGCGDGRIVIAAAKNHGAKGIGIDLNPKRIAEAREAAKAAGVEDRVRFETGDIFKDDFSDATVVALYLPDDLNRRLRPQLWRQLKVGTRVVSNESDMGKEWLPEKTEYIGGKPIHYWTIREEHKKAAT